MHKVCIIGGPLVSIIALSAVHPIVVEMFPPGTSWRIDWQTNISSTSLKQANKFPFFSPAQKETITDGCGGLIRVFRVKLESFTLMNCFVFYTWQVSRSSAHTYTLYTHTHNYFHLQVSSGVDNLELLRMALNLTHQIEYFADLLELFHIFRVSRKGLGWRGDPLKKTTWKGIRWTVCLSHSEGTNQNFHYQVQWAAYKAMLWAALSSVAPVTSVKCRSSNRYLSPPYGELWYVAVFNLNID